MARAYRAFAYFGLFSIFAALFRGFRYDPAAPWGNYGFNVLLYVAFIAPHLVMTRDWFKRAVYGEAGSALERQIYIGVTVVSWLAVLWLHRAVPGWALVSPGPLQFAATIGLIVSILSFFEGVSFAMIDGLVGVPGAAVALSHGGETPLLADGPYAKVRHPQYRAILLAGLCSVVLHPTAGQVLWCLMVGGTFIAFIPVEERQLIADRGEAYVAYMRRTPWRVVPNLW